MLRDSMTDQTSTLASEMKEESLNNVQLVSVASTVPGIGLLSPVNIDLSNLKSDETSMSRMSAGTLEPSVIFTRSPETRFAAGSLRVRKRMWL
jgi:hypothetical protein